MLDCVNDEVNGSCCIAASLQYSALSERMLNFTPDFLFTLSVSLI